MKTLEQVTSDRAKRALRGKHYRSVWRWGALITSPFSLLPCLSSCTIQADAERQGQPASQAPPFELSGVIEGFYSTPWSHGDRLDILRFMGRVGLNTYVYAPKNDPYHRSRWREPYPATERTRLAELVQTAQESNVTFWYAISPGLTMVYSDRDDYATLLSKIERVAELGVTHFGLFLDDVPTDMAHEADRDSYATLADAHVDLINTLAQDFESRGFMLSVTPTTYTDAWGDRDYIERLGEGVDPAIPLYWTGPDVATPEITVSQAERWGELIARKPLIWDNYPVNDYARWRLFLGPFRGRARDLSTSVLGIISNPMNEAHASMIALSTLADYAKDPGGYDPDISLRRALEDLYGAEGARLLAPFIEIYGDYAEDVNLFEPLYFARNAIDLEPIEAGVARLENGLAELRAAAMAGDEALSELLEEIAPFVEQTKESIERLKSDPTYELRGSRVVYRDEYDRVRAEEQMAEMSVDGDLSDWEGAAWRSLHGPPRDGSAPVRAAFRTDNRYLYIGLDVPYRPNTVRRGSHLGEGDHIALVLDNDPSDQEISAEDLFVFLSPPTSAGEISPFVHSMEFTGFMSKYVADNHEFIFNEFFLSTFTRPPAQSMAAIAGGITYATTRTDDGYHAEIALPHGRRGQLRLSLTVAVVVGARRAFSLSRRNYPANPATFAEVVLK